MSVQSTSRPRRFIDRQGYLNLLDDNKYAIVKNIPLLQFHNSQRSPLVLTQDGRIFNLNTLATMEVNKDRPTLASHMKYVDIVPRDQNIQLPPCDESLRFKTLINHTLNQRGRTVYLALSTDGQLLYLRLKNDQFELIKMLMNGIVFVIKSDFNRLNIGFVVIRCDRVNSICTIQDCDDDPRALKIGQFKDNKLPNWESSILIDENVMLNGDGLFEFVDETISSIGYSYDQNEIKNVTSFCRSENKNQGWLILNKNLRLSCIDGSALIDIPTPEPLSELLNIDNQVYLTNNWRIFYHFNGKKVVFE